MTMDILLPSSAVLGLNADKFILGSSNQPHEDCDGRLNGDLFSNCAESAANSKSFNEKDHSLPSHYIAYHYMDLLTVCKTMNEPPLEVLQQTHFEKSTSTDSIKPEKMFLRRKTSYCQGLSIERPPFHPSGNETDFRLTGEHIVDRDWLRALGHEHLQTRCYAP